MGIQINGNTDVISAADGSLTVVGADLSNPSSLNVSGVGTIANLVVTGNASIGGTITYQDVTHVDSVGIITAQQGIQVLANGLDVTGVSTFSENVNILSDSAALKLGADGDAQITHNGSNLFIKNSTGQLQHRSLVHIFENQTGSTEYARITSAGRLGIGTDVPGGTLHVQGPTGDAGQIYLTDGDAAGVSNSFLISKGGTTTTIKDRQASSNIDFGTADTTAMRIDSSQRLLVNKTTSTTSNGHSILQVASTSNDRAIAVHNFENDANGPFISLGKSRGTSINSYTIVQDDDELGNISFFGADGTDFNTVGAQIQAEVDGVVGVNSLPGRLIFATTADGENNATERLRITSSGNIGINTTSPGAKLHVYGNSASQVVTLTDGATITPDFSTGNNFTVTLGGNRTLANPTNTTVGQSGVIYIVQDGTGSRTLGVGTHWHFPAGTAPTLTTTGGSVDVFAFSVRSSTSVVANAILDVKVTA